MSTLQSLLLEIRNCRACEADLPLGPRPIVAAGEDSRILIVGQAPGVRVHQSGVPWNDPSGQRLREWMKIRENDFYDPAITALAPMGFCYPGTGDSGDLPPRPECAELWHKRLFSELKKVELTLVIGSYAQAYLLNEPAKTTLTQTVRKWREYSPQKLPLPHPSPRNNRWLKKNPWFEEEVVPYLQTRVEQILSEVRKER